MRNNTARWFRWMLVSILAGLVLWNCSLFRDDQPDYWPTDGWRTATPESQGMDSALLLNMMQVIWQRDLAINSVLIVRNGYIVLDAYSYPNHSDKARNIYSCSKSVTSALIGIAIDKGYITNINQPVLDFFPQLVPENLDADKKAMTLKHLLTMSSGLLCQDNYRHKWVGLNRMKASKNWVQYVLDLPMAEPPGTRFDYCNGVTFLLSAILQEKTGMTALAFAQQHLFDPLGISDSFWPANPQGITMGYSRLVLKPRDMAKFGFLFLHNGVWEDRQIISSDWIEESTRQHVDTSGLSGYGYQWWTTDIGAYNALGYGGQYIFVIPDKNLVVVFTSHLSSSETPLPALLVSSNIIPAIKSENPLPENAANQDALKSISALWQTTKPWKRGEIRAKTAKDTISLLPGEYINKEHGFTARYDPKLIVEDHNLEPWVVFRRKGTRGIPIFGIAVDDNSKDLKLKDSGEYLLEFYSEVPEIKNTQISKQELIRLSDGTPANYLEVKWNYRSFDMQTVAVIAYKDDKMIAIGVVSTENTPKEYLAGMAKSLKFNP